MVSMHINVTAQGPLANSFLQSWLLLQKCVTRRAFLKPLSLILLSLIQSVILRKRVIKVLGKATNAFKSECQQKVH